MSGEEPGYGSEAVDYWQAGFRGILPLPYGKKFPPPKGWTGYDAPWPSFPDIQTWVEEQPNGNLGLRLPNTVVGIDVDGYAGKRGGETLAHAELLWGKLPDTVRSTSRIDGVSGIRLFRVSAGTELETVVAFPDKGLAGIEVCQFFHRYVVAWPSFHEGTQRRYRWIDTHGNVSSDIPRPSELPELPAEWIEGLRRKSAGSATVSVDAAKNLAALPGGIMTPNVASELARAQLALTSGAGSRHDVTLAAVGALFRLAERGGETGIREALDKLAQAFITSVTKDGSRSQEEALLEWDRMVRGQRIHDLIASTPSVPTLDQLLGKKPPVQNTSEKETPRSQPFDPPEGIYSAKKSDSWQVSINDYRTDPFDAALMGVPYVSAGELEVEVQPSGQLDEFDAMLMLTDGPVLEFHIGDRIGPEDFVDPANPPGSWQYVGDDFDALLMGDHETAPEEGTTQSRTSWGLVDMAAILAGDLRPEEPSVLHRADGKPVFYRGRVNAVVGPPEAGKSWLTFMACAEEMQAGSNILILDFEDTPENVAMRCLAIKLSGRGTTKQMLIKHLGYISPDTMMGEAERDEFFGDLDRLNPTVIVVDGVNAAMTLLGLELEKNKDCTQFFQLILKPLALTGAAVITVDHVTKSREARGNYAIGAQAKRAMTDGAMLGVEAVEQFGRGRLGKLDVSVLKDKPGGVRAIAEKRGDKGIDYLGSIIVDARNEGSVDMRFVFEEERRSDSGMSPAEEKLSFMMIKVSNFLQRHDPKQQGMTGKEIRAITDSRKWNDVYAALYELTARRNVELISGEHGGPNGLYKLVHPYAGQETEADRWAA